MKANQRRRKAEFAAEVFELSMDVGELVAAAKKLLRAYDSLMPGLAHIAVPDYALVNEAPIEMRKALEPFRGVKGDRSTKKVGRVGEKGRS